MKKNLKAVFRGRLSAHLFALSLPVSIAFLIFGWNNGAWQLAYPVGIGMAVVAYVIAPNKTEES